MSSPLISRIAVVALLLATGACAGTDKNVADGQATPVPLQFASVGTDQASVDASQLHLHGVGYQLAAAHLSSPR